MADRYYQIEIIQPGNISSRVFDFLTDLEFAGQLSCGAVRIGNPDTGDWRVTWLTDIAVDAKGAATFLRQAAANDDDYKNIEMAEAAITVNVVEDCNWLEKSFRGFQPFNIGRFALRGRHDENASVPQGQIPLIIDAVTAFGSGEHPTTHGCLELLDDLARGEFDPQKLLDLGTGSGILAIAAHGLWPHAEITAVDNDPEAVRVATEYAGYNHVIVGEQPGAMICALADTPADPLVSARGPFDLIIANILAEPLRVLAPAIVDVLTPSGMVILSGLLQSQIEEVTAAYRPFGLQCVRKHIIHDWAALQLTR